MSTETPTREERKVVSALFADLVGSTALAERLDPEEVKLVIGEAIARLVSEIEKLGGHVKDLAGDGVLALFGAPVSSEDDAERAVLAGLACIEEMTAYGVEVGRSFGVEDFGVRIGVGTGPVVLGDLGAGTRIEYAAFGDTVNTAARLQSAAQPGTVLVDAETRRAVEPLFEWGEESELMLKGKHAPVRAAEARAAVRTGHRHRGLAGGPSRLVGRERELAGGRSRLEGLRDGTGGVLFVTGDVGIGKSRLLIELREAYQAGRFGLWLEGRCVSYGETLPYGPFRDLLREWLELGYDEPELRVRVATRRQVERLFENRALEIYPYLAALLGVSLEEEAAARVAELSPEALQYRTFEVIGTLFERLAADQPLVVAIEDLHWADATSIQLVERLLPVAEQAAVLLVIAQRPDRDHASWRLRETAAREFPHLTHEIALEPLSDDTDRELLTALVGAETLPDELETRVLIEAEGNPFYLEELVRSLADGGALVRAGDTWQFDHDVPVEIPPGIEKVILARIDRLSPPCRDVLTAASALGRRFGLPLLEGVVEEDLSVVDALHELQRADLVRAGRRWPQPEYRFKHALIQEAAYRSLVSSTKQRLHRRATLWLEEQYVANREEVLGLLAHHALAANDEDKAVEYLARAGDRARQEYALDEAIEHYRALLPLLERRDERQQMALVLFKLALALHTSLRFAESNAAYQRAFELWHPPAAAEVVAATLRVAAPAVPDDNDPLTALAWASIQLGMQLFDRLVEAGPERTIVPSLAERWGISDDGLHYVFKLRQGLSWSDGHELTAHDVEFGIKRVLNPKKPGASVAIYFVLENAQDYYLGLGTDPDAVGVRALDELTVEFRLAAPAPYFLSVLNRPDAGPQPRHAIEREGDAWTEPERQVVSGPFRLDSLDAGRAVLVRRDGYGGSRVGNVARVELSGSSADDDLAGYGRGEVDAVLVRYAPRSRASLAPEEEVQHGPAAGTIYLSFDHTKPPLDRVEFRRALAHALHREGLEQHLPANYVLATGGLVPPALQGHTPDIGLRFDPDLARSLLPQRAENATLRMAASPADLALAETVGRAWNEVLGVNVHIGQGRVGVAGDREGDVIMTGWLPGYPDPEYFLRLLLHSQSKTNEGGFAYAPFDELIERARRERSDRSRLELFHEADRMAVADRVAVIPIAYAQSLSFVKPWVKGWWEFGKSSASFADLVVNAER